MTPELVRRACEAYNKSKSVHTLQKRAADDRAEEFPLIDSDLVINQVYGYHQKAAMGFELNPPTLQDNLLQLHEGLKKVAADDAETNELDDRAISRQIYRTRKDIEKQIERFHAKVASHRERSESAMHRVCQIIRRLPDRQIQKVARLTVNRYGDDGVRFMKIIGAFTENEFPLQKTAAAAIFPLEEPYTSVSIAIDEARTYSHYDKVLKKIAGPAWEANKQAAKDAWVNTLSAEGFVPGLVRGGGTALKTVSRRLLDPVVELAKAPVIEQLQKGKTMKRDEVFGPELRNQLQQLQAQQSFIEVASDDFTKDYPIDDILQAYNNVVGTTPDMLDPKYTPWLKALVREQLVQGNVYDAATIRQIQEIGKDISKSKMSDVEELERKLKIEGPRKEVAGLSPTRAEAIIEGGKDVKPVEFDPDKKASDVEAQVRAREAADRARRKEEAAIDKDKRQTKAEEKNKQFMKKVKKYNKGKPPHLQFNP
jgi:hypothetical protein